jgi:hypothetical protein
MSAADAITATVATSSEGIPSVPFSFVVDVAKYCVGMLLALAFLDYFFARQWQGRYFVLHTAANAAIALAVLPDVFNIVTDPVSTLRLTSCWAFPTGACFAIHFYHMLAPGFVLYSVDWLHHILMVVLGCPCIIAGQVGPLMNFNLFFICGVPGGIDYLMLALVKERLMLPLTEKKHNNTIQVSDPSSARVHGSSRSERWVGTRAWRRALTGGLTVRNRNPAPAVCLPRHAGFFRFVRSVHSLAGGC